MAESDIPEAISLTRPLSWNQTEEDWQRFLSLEPHGCFVAVSEGEVVATTTTGLFGGVGWVGMVTVSAGLRGQGLGRAMMQEAIRYLRARGARTIKLDATPMGKPLYDRLGFREEYGLQRVVGIGVKLEVESVTPLGRAGVGAFDALLDLDRSAYFIDRSQMIARLVAGWPQLAALHTSAGIVDGYIVGRHGFLYEHLGPMVATNKQAADSLLRWGMACATGMRVVLDRPDANSRACGLAESYGFEPLRQFTRMHLGREPYLDAPELIFATSGAEKG